MTLEAFFILYPKTMLFLFYLMIGVYVVKLAENIREVHFGEFLWETMALPYLKETWEESSDGLREFLNRPEIINRIKKFCFFVWYSFLIMIWPVIAQNIWPPKN